VGAGADAMTWWMRAAQFLSWIVLVAVAGVLVYTEVARPKVPTGVRAYTDVIYRHVGSRRARLDVYRPTEAMVPSDGWPAIVAIHGGGWRGGTKNGYGREVARLATAGYVVVSVDYALSSPGHPTWPDNFEDVREAVRWVRRNAADYGIDPNRIAALGASAGGHLATLLGTNAGGSDPDSRVDAVVNLYGPSDLASLFQSPGAVLPLMLYLGCRPMDAPDVYAAASPMAHVSADDAPTLLIHGEADRLVPVAQSVDLAGRLQAVGVPAEVIVVEGVGHAFGFEVPGGSLVPPILAFLERSLAPRLGRRSRRDD
jgi:acetyl esterase/lipase